MVTISGCLAIQEYYNHDAVVFKVFAVRDQVHIVRRPSLRNMNPGGCLIDQLALSKRDGSALLTPISSQPEKDCITFNSQDPLPDTLFDKSFDVQVIHILLLWPGLLASRSQPFAHAGQGSTR